MEPPANRFSFFLSILNGNLTTGDYLTVAVCLAVIVILVLCSGMISGSENAFFSLSKIQAEELTLDDTRTAQAARYLLHNPKNLLATILIGNTFVNIAVVMVSTLMFDMLFHLQDNPVSGFIFEVGFVTFTIVLFGEVMPKIYASQNNVRIAKLLAIPMYTLAKILSPFAWILVKSTSVIDKRITKKGHVLSADELTHAIDITAEPDTSKEEKSILKSIVNFGNTNVKQIMRQRPDISALESGMGFPEVLSKINDWGYSRVPVYTDNLDNIAGVLYIKDLLPHLDKPGDFNWMSLVRSPYFVPESKKIDDLLKEFQNKRVHLAVVVDEFGGTSGLATMEDILEEIFGEIRDEFDEDENFYSKINDHTFVFEAKMLINDMCRYMEVDTSVFDDVRNEADTIGGMLLELSGELPKQGETLEYGKFTFLIEAADKRRIKRVKVMIGQEKGDTQDA